ncbi:MAG TPA: hypothetical protein VLH75_16240 [Longimicrobiales bacterium]|nr:hypothetical protein [Longimicrobiales bacterium]
MWTALVLAALAAACTDAVLPVLTTWQATLQPTSPAQRVLGEVAVLSQSGRAETSIKIFRSDPGVTYAWRILTGACGVQGDAVAGRAVYPQLEAGSDGVAEGRTTLSRELDAEGSYAAWLFQRGAGGTESVAACGVLQRQR